MAGIAGLEPAKCRSQSPVPYRLGDIPTNNEGIISYFKVVVNGFTKNDVNNFTKNDVNNLTKSFFRVTIYLICKSTLTYRNERNVK